MKLSGLLKQILVTPWLGLVILSPATAEPVPHRTYYSIQALSGTPAALKNARQKARDLPFMRIEKHANQHKLRIGFWSSKQEAENQLTEIKGHFRDAFVFTTEYKPDEILLGWTVNAASPPENPANTIGRPIAVTGGQVKPLPVPSNIISTAPGGSSRLGGSLAASSNIASLQKNIQPDTVAQSGAIVAEDRRTTGTTESSAAPLSPVKVAISEFLKKQPPMPDETPLWQLLQNEQYDALQVELSHMRAKYGKWQPPQELLSFLQQGKLRQKVDQAIQNNDMATLIQLGELHPEDFSCTHIDWAWALAEAQVSLKQPDALHAILYRLIPDCSEQDRLATLYKAKPWLDITQWEALLERELQVVRSDEGENKFRRLRYDHSMEKLLVAHQAQNQTAFRTLLLQLDGDIEHYRDTDAALLGGWHYFNAQETAAATLWFNKALTWNPEQHDARRGLALSALKDKRFSEAKRLADTLPVGSEGREELLHTVAVAMAPGPRLLAMSGAETNTVVSYTAAYAGIIMPVHSSLGGLGNGIVQRLWVDRLGYSYGSGDQVTQAVQEGIEGSLGYQKSGPWGSWAAFAGAVYRDTQLSPPVANNPASGGHVRGRIQVEGERILNDKWRVNINANYVTGQNSYWARSRVLYNLNERFLTGPEGIILGDPKFQIMQYGWAMMGLRVLFGTDVTIRVGARKTMEGTTMHVGLELARPF